MDTAGTRPESYTRNDLHACTLAASEGLHRLQSLNLHRQRSLFAALGPGVMQLFLEVITSRAKIYSYCCSLVCGISMPVNARPRTSELNIPSFNLMLTHEDKGRDD